mmetsp:Transcript_32559/g.49800  ORF Transcript_32559/g.49800 Transcript_32559/m.49800 type:complete len:110 (+) Transcript_32559:84-413(+)
MMWPFVILATPLLALAVILLFVNWQAGSIITEINTALAFGNEWALWVAQQLNPIFGSLEFPLYVGLALVILGVGSAFTGSMIHILDYNFTAKQASMGLFNLPFTYDLDG